MFKELFIESKMSDVQKRFAKDGEVQIITADGIWVLVDEIEKNIAYGIDNHDNEVEINLTKDKYNIAEKVLVEGDIENIAKAVKGKSLFDMDKPLKKAGFKTTSMGYTAIKVTKGSNSWYIASEKNAEAGEDDIIQDGYVIGEA